MDDNREKEVFDNWLSRQCLVSSKSSSGKLEKEIIDRLKELLGSKFNSTMAELDLLNGREKDFALMKACGGTEEIKIEDILNVRR